MISIIKWGDAFFVLKQKARSN